VRFTRSALARSEGADGLRRVGDVGLARRPQQQPHVAHIPYNNKKSKVKNDDDDDDDDDDDTRPPP